MASRSLAFSSRMCMSSSMPLLEDFGSRLGEIYHRIVRGTVLFILHDAFDLQLAAEDLLHDFLNFARGIGRCDFVAVKGRGETHGDGLFFESQDATVFELHFDRSRGYLVQDFWPRSPEGLERELRGFDDRSRHGRLADGHFDLFLDRIFHPCRP